MQVSGVNGIVTGQSLYECRIEGDLLFRLRNVDKTNAGQPRDLFRWAGSIGVPYLCGSPPRIGCFSLIPQDR